MRLFLCFLIFISFSSYSNLYIDDNYDLILEKDKGVIKRYDIFNDVKFDLKNGNISNYSIYISMEKEDGKYILSTDLFSSRYYEYFDIIDNGDDNFTINKITTVSVDKSDFDSKTVTCTSNVEIPIIDFKHGEKNNSAESCEITYPLKNSLSDFENYIFSIYKNKYYLIEISKGRIDSYLSRYPLSDDTVSYYNNITFYLIEGGCPKAAIYLLEDIISKFKDREVAYINLGDAYLSVNQKEKAINMYSIYISKMKSKGKEKRIPSRIYRVLNG
ncbi:tetratricopeptide repeat protein [Aggregatibacter actinomycetemcomitans]|uniref:tetratricopeptide repeat protein n=1 Tax=Aggregatibacter actinomycetemcomitans TaxID=714 RepID=UPI0021CC9CC2|nr:tetratricopeptide repeat protein [Aggregatibacter actinomycetemcomitans]